MSKVEPFIERVNGPTAGYLFDCPGCGMPHEVYTIPRSNRAACWQFNGDLDRPTFSPSLLVRVDFEGDRPSKICHSFVKDGKIQFLSDCTHALAGQTVELPEVE